MNGLKGGLLKLKPLYCWSKKKLYACRFGMIFVEIKQNNRFKRDIFLSRIKIFNNRKLYFPEKIPIDWVPVHLLFTIYTIIALAPLKPRGRLSRVLKIPPERFAYLSLTLSQCLLWVIFKNFAPLDSFR